MSRASALHFEKWEGLGNDFVVIEVVSEDAVSPAEARVICDRHRGVGADGVLLVVRGAAEPRMVVLNADGSRPEMCGNGLRCVAGFLAESMHADGLSLVVATDAGDKPCAVERRGPGLYEVTIDMGRGVIGAPLVVEALGRTHTFATVDMGNPHAITFDAYPDAEIDAVAKVAAVAPASGTNVEFCRMSEGGARIDVTVWERGVGRTLACGTGACAVAVAAREAGLSPGEAPIEVVLPGGPLEIVVGPDRDVSLRGPARRVFRGTWEVER